MSDKETVTARLDIEVFVECPNEDCEALIDLLCEKDTDGTNHDDDNAILGVVFGKGEWREFYCNNVVCSKCKTEFNVKELEW